MCLSVFILDVSLGRNMPVLDDRMVDAAELRILSDLMVTFDGQTERSLIKGLALKANVAKEALKRLVGRDLVYPIDSQEGSKYFVTESGRRKFYK
jgi:predicted transcriptional regulator